MPYNAKLHIFKHHHIELMQLGKSKCNSFSFKFKLYLLFGEKVRGSKLPSRKTLVVVLHNCQEIKCSSRNQRCILFEETKIFYLFKYLKTHKF